MTAEKNQLPTGAELATTDPFLPASSLVKVEAKLLPAELKPSWYYEDTVASSKSVLPFSIVKVSLDYELPLKHVLNFPLGTLRERLDEILLAYWKKHEEWGDLATYRTNLRICISQCQNYLLFLFLFLILILFCLIFLMSDLKEIIDITLTTLTCINGQVFSFSLVQ